MAAISTQTLNFATGAEPTFTAASASDDLECPSTAGQIFVVYKNTNAATRDIAITMAQTEVYGNTLPAPGTGNKYTIGATTGVLYIPLLPQYNNGSGRVTVTCTASAVNVTVAVVSFP